MSAVDTSFYEKKKTQTFYLALWFLIFTLCATWGLYYYGNTLWEKIDENAANINQLETAISKIQEKEKVQIFSTYAQNETIFSDLSEKSKIPSMINHLIRIFNIQDIQYRWFNYSDGRAEVALSIETNDAWYAYEKVTKFLKTYRENEEARFDVAQISEFTWYDRMNFTADFILK